MGGHQIPAMGPGDDGWDEDGYDESQRAEIIETTNDAPSDGTILTDIPIDLGEDGDEDDTDELRMVDDELGEEDDEVDLAEEDIREDDIQDDFDDEEEDLDEELDDGDDIALEP
ncbi:MAG TPA: DNA primase [Sphingomonas sp.]|nr:DNA primase [Sphingomonas sp.]